MGAIRNIRAIVYKHVILLEYNPKMSGWMGRMMKDSVINAGKRTEQHVHNFYLFSLCRR